MYEGARLYIAVRVYMQVGTPAGDTAVHIFAVIPKIHGENRFCLPELSYLVIHILSLLGCCDEVKGCIGTDGYVCEKPREFATLLYEKVKVLAAAYRFGIFACIAERSPKGKLLFP